MSTDLVKVEEGLKALKLDRVVEFTKKLDDISKGFNTMLAPMYIRDFIMAYDVTNGLYSQAMRFAALADSALKTAESIAYFDNAASFLESKGVKDSDAARRRYIPMDPEVQNAERIKAQADAMASFLRNKMQEFRMGYDSVKKIAYSNDYNHDSPNEGM